MKNTENTENTEKTEKTFNLLCTKIYAFVIK